MREGLSFDNIILMEVIHFATCKPAFFKSGWRRITTRQVLFVEIVVVDPVIAVGQLKNSCSSSRVEILAGIVCPADNDGGWELRFGPTFERRAALLTARVNM